MRRFPAIAVLAAVLLLGGFFITLLLAGSNQQAKEAAYFQDKAQRLRTQVEAALGASGRVAAYAYARDLRTCALLRRLSSIDDHQEKHAVRQRLRALLVPVFQRLRPWGIDALRVVLPNKTVFLRMERPDLFDDREDRREPLPSAVIAPGIAEADLSGAGYAFAFPLGSPQSPGTVLLRMSFPALTHALQNLFGTRSVVVLAAQTVQRLHPSAAEGFRPLAMAERFRIHETFWQGYTDLVSQLGLRMTVPDLAQRMESGHVFSFAAPQREGERWTSVAFLPLQDNRHHLLGYVIAYEEDRQYPVMREYYNLLRLFIALSFLLLSWTVGSFLVAHRQLAFLATRDPLTETLTRRAFFEAAEREQARARRRNTPFCLLLFDLDHFKAVNDTHGHHVGDMVLRRITQTIRQSVRNSDMLGRLGGDEFALLLPDTSLEKARNTAERLRKAVVATDFSPASGISVSIGVMAAQDPEEPLDRLLERADHAMYRAKATGRNQVI